MSGRRALFIEYAFWDRHVFRDILSRDRDRNFDRVAARGRDGAELLVRVEDKTVLVPMISTVEVQFHGDWDPGPVSGLLPDDLAAAHPGLARVTEDLRYDEKALNAEQEVELLGWVEPVPRAQGIYRAAPSAHDFVALSKRGVRLTETGRSRS